MKFKFTEKKVQVSDDLRAYAERKIGKLDRFFKIESEAFVTFGIERGRHKAEVTINNNGMFYRVTNAGVREAHPHDVKIIKEAPNYRS